MSACLLQNKYLFPYASRLFNVKKKHTQILKQNLKYQCINSFKVHVLFSTENAASKLFNIELLFCEYDWGIMYNICFSVYKYLMYDTSVLHHAHMYIQVYSIIIMYTYVKSTCKIHCML